jgi:hypothetical protein
MGILALNMALAPLGPLLAFSLTVDHPKNRSIRMELYCTVLSEIGFPFRTAATKFAPHGRQGLFDH